MTPIFRPLSPETRVFHAKLDALIRANSPALPLIAETIEAAYKHGGRTTIVYLTQPDALPVFDGPGSPRT